MGHYLLFLTASLVLLAVPGPAVLFIVSRSADRGSKAGLASVAGVAAGGIVHVIFAVCGVSALLTTSSGAFTSFKYVGAGFLMLLGLFKFFEGRKIDSAKPLKARNLKTIFIQGFFVQLFNPKIPLFFLSFLPQFIDVKRGYPVTQMFGLGITFVVLAFFSDSLYAILAGRLTAMLARHKDWPALGKWLAGSIYIAMGLGAALFNWR